MIFIKGRSLPEWICGEVRVKGLLTVQGHHVCVPGVNEDVGPTMDGGQGRTWHHLHSNTIITVHHAADDLNLQSNDSFGSQIQEWKKVSLRANACGTYPCYSSVSIIAQEVAGKCESLHVCVYVGQREDPSCRVKQGPGVTKASWLTVHLSLIGHPQTDNLVPSHLEDRRGQKVWNYHPSVTVPVLLLECTCSFEGPMFLTGGGWQLRCIDCNIWLIYLGCLLAVSCQCGINDLFLLWLKNVYCYVLLLLVSKEFYG